MLEGAAIQQIRRDAGGAEGVAGRGRAELLLKTRKAVDFSDSPDKRLRVLAVIYSGL